MNKGMASADTGIDPSWHGVQRNQGITVTPNQDRLMAGSCNACTDVSRDRNAYETVTEVDLRGLSFRLCDRCRVKLKELL